MPEANTTPITDWGTAPSLVQRITRSPIAGLAPWILLAANGESALPEFVASEPVVRQTDS